MGLFDKKLPTNKVENLPVKKEEKLVKRGRPSTYTNEIADKICDLLGSSEMSIRLVVKKLKKEPGYEDITEKAVWRWLNKEMYFREKYLRARELQSEIGYDKMREIADAPLTHNGKPENDPIDPGIPLSKERAQAEIARRNQMIDIRKFALMKLQPKRYGRQVVDIADTSTKRVVDANQFQQLMSALVEAGKQKDDDTIEFEEL